MQPQCIILRRKIYFLLLNYIVYFFIKMCVFSNVYFSYILKYIRKIHTESHYQSDNVLCGSNVLMATVFSYKCLMLIIHMIGLITFVKGATLMDYISSEDIFSITETHSVHKNIHKAYTANVEEVLISFINELLNKQRIKVKKNKRTLTFSPSVGRVP